MFQLKYNLESKKIVLNLKHQETELQKIKFK